MNELENINSQIVSAVVKWGAITHEDLHSYLNLNSKLSTLHVRTHNLIKNKYLKSTRLMSQKRPILCACEGTKALAGDEIKIVNSSHLAHDSILSNICIKLLQQRNIYDINVTSYEDAFDKLSIVPDADALVFTKEGSLNVAIEFENTQKSRVRLMRKFQMYSESHDYQYVFYFFNTEREAVVYANTLIAMEKGNSLEFKKLNLEKFYFFLRKTGTDSNNFSDNFESIYPIDSTKIEKLLNDNFTTSNN
jgi:hypothetical protein